MKRNLLTSIFLPLLLIAAVGITIFCFKPLFSTPIKNRTAAEKSIPAPANVTRVGNIPLPDGFERVAVAKGSFAEWLQNVGIKKDNTVYLYNGQPKRNQEAQYAVLNIPVGKKDLQQCADAV